MTNLMFVVLVVIVLVAIVAFFNTSFGKKLKVKITGRSEEIMRQDASTLEGARDYFNAAIREKEEFNSNAQASFMQISGKLEIAEKELYEANKEIMKITKQINSCLDDGNESDAMTYALKKTTIENKINVLKNTIDEMKQAKSHQKEVCDQAAADLQELKEEKDRTLFQMEADSQVIEMHQSMNNLVSNNETDRMLDRVREGARKTRERAEGSRIAYDSSTQAADRRLEASERERTARQTLEEIKRQRNQRNGNNGNNQK